MPDVGFSRDLPAWKMGRVYKRRAHALTRKLKWNTNAGLRIYYPGKVCLRCREFVLIWLRGLRRFYVFLGCDGVPLSPRVVAVVIFAFSHILFFRVSLRRGTKGFEADRQLARHAVFAAGFNLPLLIGALFVTGLNLKPLNKS